MDPETGQPVKIQMNPDGPSPLCVDLDGTLLLSNSWAESFCLLLKSEPWMLLRLPVWLLRGRANLKSEIALRVNPDVRSWPLNVEVLGFLQAAKSSGRTIVLVTTADRRVAAAMQSRLNLFDDIISGDGAVNLTSESKAAALQQRFGSKNFDYLGNHPADLPVWEAARSAGLVGPEDGARARLAGRIKKSTPVEWVFTTPRISVKDCVQALRVHQWSKNLLLLVPVISAHQWTDPAHIWPVILGVAAFSLCASSVYLLNDLLDLEADRHHLSKRHRPFASGKIPLLAGLGTAPVLLVLSAAMACCLGWKFMAFFAAYYLTTLLYSLRLKQVALLDVLTLAGLYCLRILAGGIAADVPVSDWLMMFSLFVFLSLAFVKRFTEIRVFQNADDGKLKGRGYESSDAELVGTMGIASGYLSVLVLAMYITHPSVTSLYGNPQVLWLTCPLLLYWISRVWLLAHRQAMHEDPILFALRDRQSWIVLILMAAIGFAAGPR